MKRIAIVLYAICLVCLIACGNSNPMLSMRVDIDDHCMLHMPIVCSVSVWNVSSTNVEIYEPSGYAETIMGTIRSVTNTQINRISADLSSRVDRKKRVTLKPGEQTVGLLMIETASLALKPGTYVCEVAYRYAATNTISELSKSFALAYPDKKVDVIAANKCFDIQKLVRAGKSNDLSMAIVKISEFDTMQSSVASNYMLYARFVVSYALARNSRWIEFANQMEVVTRSKPNWLCDESSFRDLCYTYWWTGQYERIVSLLDVHPTKDFEMLWLLDKANCEIERLRKKPPK